MLNCSNIRFLLLIAGVLVHASPLAVADIFTIDHIAVDVTAQNSVEAQSIAFGNARRIGAERLIDRLTLPEDREAVGGVWMDDQLASSLAAAVDVLREKRSGTRYYGVLSVKFSEKKIAEFLGKQGLPFVRSSAAPGLLVPVAVGQGVDLQSWRTAWTALQSGHLLTPVIISPVLYHPAVEWKDLSVEAERGEVLRGIVAELARHNGLDYVRLTEVRPDAPREVLGVAGPFTGIDEAASGALEYLETVWKRLTVARGDSRSEYRASALYGSQSSWRFIRDSLEQTASVSDLRLHSIMTGAADLSFSYAGAPEQLAAELGARGVSLSRRASVWVLRKRNRR